MLRAALLLTSLANSAAGVALGALYFQYQGLDGMPLVVLFVAVALFIQGAYTIGYLAGMWRRWRNLDTQLFVAGEFAAALVGSIATVQAILYNLHPKNGDFEFGPLIAAVLMTVQAFAGLLYAVRAGLLPVASEDTTEGQQRS
jgi:hypothetical protein